MWLELILISGVTLILCWFFGMPTDKVAVLGFSVAFIFVIVWLVLSFGDWLADRVAEALREELVKIAIELLGIVKEGCK